MKFTVLLKKMDTEFYNPVQYYLNTENSLIIVNQLIGQKLHLKFVASQCLNCNKQRHIFRQGFCKPCFFDIPQAADWVMRPELSKAHLNVEDRDLEYEKRAQLQPHIVYLAWSGGLKVGVTRKIQVPTRWIDQGATWACPILEVPNRYLAGIAEVALKTHFSDKTNWRKMLTETPEKPLFSQHIEIAKTFLNEEIRPFLVTENILKIDYPAKELPQKVTSLNFDKTPEFKGTLSGIKGQYWIFDNETVCNIRSNEGKILDIELIV